MNIIEAWEKADGKAILIKDNIKTSTSKSNGDHKDIRKFICGLRNEELFSKDWEIDTKTRVMWVITYRNLPSFEGHISHNTTIFFSRDFMESWKEQSKNNIKILGIEKYIDEY